MIWRKVDEIASGLHDALNVLARMNSVIHAIQQDQRGLRQTLDLLLLQQQKQSEQHAAGLVALLGAEVESEEERAEREKLEKEFEEFQDVMKRLEEV